MCKEKRFFGISAVRGSHLMHPLCGLSVWAFLCLLKGLLGMVWFTQTSGFQKNAWVKKKTCPSCSGCITATVLGNCFRSAKIATCGYSLSVYFAKCAGVVGFFPAQNIVFPLFFAIRSVLLIAKVIPARKGKADLDAHLSPFNIALRV